MKNIRFAKRKFDDKVKSNPVWLVNQRAYKTHYARIMQKKMSKPEFADWTDMAVKLRARAIAGEIIFEDYVKKLENSNHYI